MRAIKKEHNNWKSTDFLYQKYFNVVQMIQQLYNKKKLLKYVQRKFIRPAMNFPHVIRVNFMPSHRDRYL